MEKKVNVSSLERPVVASPCGENGMLLEWLLECCGAWLSISLAQLPACLTSPSLS